MICCITWPILTQPGSCGAEVREGDQKVNLTFYLTEISSYVEEEWSHISVQICKTEIYPHRLNMLGRQPKVLVLNTVKW